MFSDDKIEIIIIFCCLNNINRRYTTNNNYTHTHTQNTRKKKWWELILTMHRCIWIMFEPQWTYVAYTNNVFLFCCCCASVLDGSGTVHNRNSEKNESLLLARHYCPLLFLQFCSVADIVVAAAVGVQGKYYTNIAWRKCSRAQPKTIFPWRSQSPQEKNNKNKALQQQTVLLLV